MEEDLLVVLVDGRQVVPHRGERGPGEGGVEERGDGPGRGGSILRGWR